MTNNRRRITVHDLTALSLHPTGSSARPHQTSAVRDVRGNWIARDAGGRGSVPKRKGVTRDEDVEEDDDKAGVENNSQRIVTRDKDMGQNLKDKRARKRRKLIDDVEFLHEEPHNISANRLNNRPATAVEGVQASSLLEFSIPSSVRPLADPLICLRPILVYQILNTTFTQDLLKQIHHFTAHYYASQNILFDSTRLYRRERKKERAEHIKASSQLVEESDDDAEDEAEKLEEDEAEVGLKGEDRDDEESEGDEPGPSKAHRVSKGKSTNNTTTKPKSKMKKGKGKASDFRRDMYKVFDGSALMVLGMFVFPLFPHESPLN